MKFYSQNSTRRLGWAFRASSKLLFFSTRTSSSSVISARLATTSVQRSTNFIIVAEGVDSGITGTLVWDFFGLFFPLLKVWESSWYFVSTATNVAQARRKQRGSSGVRMRIYQAERQFVLNCDWTAAGCTWKWMAALQATHQRLTTPQSAVLQAVNYLCSNFKLASVRWLFWLCLFYYCSIVLWLNYAKMSIFRFFFYWLTKLSLVLISFFYYLYLRVWFFSRLSW